MGTKYSHSNYVEKSPKPTSSPVRTFHSSPKWKNYFEESNKTNKLMVIDFMAAWCGPCLCTEPIMEEFAAKYTEVDFIKIDEDKLTGVTQEFQVQAMPTFILIKKGEVIDRLVGANKAELKKMIEKHRK